MIDQPLVLGTAGHIDHGKTALVTLLTGKNTDRLREERERGISIELGYAELVLPSGRRLSVVDVPGHERFVRTMVAGASGIDLFLLVVAADDGIMPQTEEHLAVLDLLGVRHGVVAVTKADLVDEELLQMVLEDVLAYLQTTSFADTPIVAVSARDGRGIPQLLGALEEVASAVVSRRGDGPARLPVDRVFSMKGVGTVVTGSLWRGAIHPGDTLLVRPGGQRAVVRGVQVHDRDVDAAYAGQRVAVNIRGAERTEFDRGIWLAGPSVSQAVTRSFDVVVRLLPEARPVGVHSTIRLHHGTSRHVARLLPVSGDELVPGEDAVARVRLEDEAVVEPHDRFILRTMSPATTEGGGEILDVAPRRWKDKTALHRYLISLAAGDAVDAVMLAGQERGLGGVATADFLTTALSEEAVAAALLDAAADGRMEALELGSGEVRWFAKGLLAEARTTLRGLLDRQAEEHPERSAMTTDQMSDFSGIPLPAVTEAVLAELLSSGEVAQAEGGWVSAAAGGRLAPPLQRLAVSLLELVGADPLSPPTLAMLLESLAATSPAAPSRREVLAVLDVLSKRGELVRVKEDLWFTTAAEARAREVLLDVLSRQSQITLAEYRDAAGVGRRNAQALLEYFDRQGLTRRSGDARVLRGRR